MNRRLRRWQDGDRRFFRETPWGSRRRRAGCRCRGCRFDWSGTARSAPKRVFVCPLGRQARAALGGLDEPESWGAGRDRPEPPTDRGPATQPVQIPARGSRVPRGARRVRHRLATVLAVSVAATSSPAPTTRAAPGYASVRMPRNLACLSNAVISIVRMNARFRHQPQAHRHYAARQADALREILQPAV